MSEQQVNPETAFHRRTIARERDWRRRSGIFGMSLFGFLFVLFTVICIIMVVQREISLGSFIQLFLLIVGFLGSMFYLMGVDEYQQGKQPITDQEVEQRRRNERTQLFREAQGELPHVYRPWCLHVERIVGVLFAVGGLACLIFSFPVPGTMSIVYGVGLLFCATLLLWMALYVKPRRSKHLASWSARELTSRITLGEVTEGTRMEDDSLP